MGLLFSRAVASLALLAGLLSAGESGLDQLRKDIELLKQQLAGAGQGRTVRIGTVDIVRVFDELEEKIDMNAELRLVEEKRTTRLRELGDRVRELEEKAKLLRPESEEAKANDKQLEETSREFRSHRDATEDHLYNKLYDFTLGIYKKIRDEVQVYAREAGYDIVLRTRDTDVGDLDQTLRPRTRYMELNRRIDSQNVLFSNPALDFTDTIIKRLNSRYQSAKAERERLQPSKPPAKTDAGTQEAPAKPKEPATK